MPDITKDTPHETAPDGAKDTAAPEAAPANGTATATAAAVPDRAAAELRETDALTSWSTTRPQLEAGLLTRAFVRLNVYLYSRPPSKIQKSINKFFLNVNVHLYRASQGRLMGRFGGLEALLLTTLGRKTGVERITPVAYVYDDGRFHVVAVPGHFDIPGGPKAAHPNWYLNLRATPKATIDIGKEQIEVVAEQLSGDERYRIWERFTNAYPFIAEFQNRAGRLLPIMRLTPQDLNPREL